MDSLSWKSAATFCERLSVREGLAPFYVSKGGSVTVERGAGYRFPTEAEWEFACRAGTTSAYWPGNESAKLSQTDWLRENCDGHPHPVGELAPNPFGLFDMHGNVNEWCHDRWHPSYYSQFQDRPAVDPWGPDDPEADYVERGGNWYFPYVGCRSAFRQAQGKNYPRWGFHTGLRAALSVDGVRAALKQQAGNIRSPDFDRWMKDIVALPAEKQVESVAKKLQELNPEFDGKTTHKVENGLVTEFGFCSNNVTDISPVRALEGLLELQCNGRSFYRRGMLSNLSPLKGLRLRGIACRETAVSDLSPLKGMPLKTLVCYATSVSDLSPLKGMPLTTLICLNTKVSDLSPLKGMPLTILKLNETQVSDLSNLIGMPLEVLHLHRT